MDTRSYDDKKKLFEGVSSQLKIIFLHFTKGFRGDFFLVLMLFLFYFVLLIIHRDINRFMRKRSKRIGKRNRKDLCNEQSVRKSIKCSVSCLVLVNVKNVICLNLKKIIVTWMLGKSCIMAMPILYTIHRNCILGNIKLS